MNITELFHSIYEPLTFTLPHGSGSLNIMRKQWERFPDVMNLTMQRVNSLGKIWPSRTPFSLSAWRDTHPTSKAQGHRPWYRNTLYLHLRLTTPHQRSSVLGQGLEIDMIIWCWNSWNKIWEHFASCMILNFLETCGKLSVRSFFSNTHILTKSYKRMGKLKVTYYVMKPSYTSHNASARTEL